MKISYFEKLLSESKSNYKHNMIGQISYDLTMQWYLNTQSLKIKVDQIRQGLSDDTIEPYEYDHQINAIALDKIVPVQIKVIGRSQQLICSSI